MPRNPDKRRCTAPNCRNWAMRGYTQCRSHATPHYGWRTAGAPNANLNALKLGLNARPLKPLGLHALVQQLIEEPDAIGMHIGWLTMTIYERTGRKIYRTLAAVRASITQILPVLLEGAFDEALANMLLRYPEPNREQIAQVLYTRSLAFDPLDRLLFLRRAQDRLDERFCVPPEGSGLGFYELKEGEVPAMDPKEALKISREVLKGVRARLALRK